MMIQSSNPLSVLSNTENKVAGQADLPAKNGVSGDFTSDFLQQLALLQGSSTGTVIAPDSTDAGQDVQNFAALDGKSPPTAKKAGQDINLADALNTLSDVLQYLQSLHIDAPGAAQSQPAIDYPAQDAAGQDSAKNVASLSNTLSADSAGLPKTLADIGVLPDTQAVLMAGAFDSVPVKSDSSAHVDTKAALTDQSGLAPQGAGTPDLAAVALLLPAQPVQPLQQSQTKDISGEMPMAFAAAVNNEPAMLKPLPQPTNNTESKPAGIAAFQAGNNQPPPVLDGAMTGAMFNQGNTPQNAGQDQQTRQDNGADDLITVSAKPSGSVAANKNPADMANAIAQLNQAVPGGKIGEAPAMTNHISHPDWNQELAQKLIWMHKQDLPSAELRLNPPHLGPLSIKVDVDQDQATISFTTQHAAVKEAIEAAMPKLREMLGGQQLNLADVNVSQQQAGEKQAKDFFQTASQQGRGSKSNQNGPLENFTNQAGVDVLEEINSGRAIVGNGLLSLFA